MRLDLNMEIRVPSGERAGWLRKVVLDMDNNLIQIVIATGDLISRDVIVPVNLLSEGPGGDIFINSTSDEFTNLTNYVEDDVPVVADGWMMNENATPMGEVFSETTYQPIVPIVEVPNLPEGAIGLGEETEIWCRDERWGVLDEIITTDESTQLQALVGRPDDNEEPGGMVTKRFIPANLIQEVDATTIVLNCSLDELPQYTEEMSGVVDEEAGA